jgi:hypothetical protein
MKKKIIIVGILLLFIIFSSAFFLYSNVGKKANLEKAQKFYDLGLDFERKADFGNALKNFKLAEKFAPSGSPLKEKARKKVEEVEKKAELAAGGSEESAVSGEGVTSGDTEGGSDTGGESSSGENNLGETTEQEGSSGGAEGTYFPDITGFSGGSILKEGNQTVRVYDYMQGDDLKTLVITVYDFDSEEKASSFADRVSAELYKDATKTVDFEDVKDAFYGENRNRNKSTIVWSEKKTTVEIILTALDAPISNYYQYLVDIAEKVNY